MSDIYGGRGKNNSKFQAPGSKKERTDFFNSKAGEIQFEYDAWSDTVRISEWGDEALEAEKFISNVHSDYMYAVDEDTYKKLLKKIRNAAPDNPYVDAEVLLNVKGELRRHRLFGRIFWTEEAEKLKYRGIIGKLTDIHEQSPGNTDNRSEAGEVQKDLMSLIKKFESVFDSVRLIDGVKCRKTVMNSIESEKAFSIEKCADYNMAMAAYERKSRISKIRFEGSKIYHVIEKYIDTEKGGCVLELVSSIDQEFSMDFYGENENIADKIINYNKTAVIDPLTEAYNRRYYEEYAKALNGIEGVVMFDLDKFKYVNDKYGHETGDTALKCFSAAVKSRIRGNDIFIRFGGDEFLLLFPKIKREAFEDKLNNILEAVKEASVKGFPDIKLSASIGGVYNMYPVLKAVKTADRLMYEVKKNGRGHILCYFEEDQ